MKSNVNVWVQLLEYTMGTSTSILRLMISLTELSYFRIHPSPSRRHHLGQIRARLHLWR